MWYHCSQKGIRGYLLVSQAKMNQTAKEWTCNTWWNHIMEFYAAVRREKNWCIWPKWIDIKHVLMNEKSNMWTPSNIYIYYNIYQIIEWLWGRRWNRNGDIERGCWIKRNGGIWINDVGVPWIRNMRTSGVSTCMSKTKLQKIKKTNQKTQKGLIMDTRD